MKPYHAEPSLSSAAITPTAQGGGGGGEGEVGGSFAAWIESVMGFAFCFGLALVTMLLLGAAFGAAVKFVLCAAAKFALDVAAKVMGWLRSPPTERSKLSNPKLSTVAESHLSASNGDRALLRKRFQATNERHPELRGLMDANYVSCLGEGVGGEWEEEGGAEEGRVEEKLEEEVDVLQKKVVGALVESRRLAREDLQTTKTSENDLRNALRSMRESLAATDESYVEQELLEEIEAFAEADIGAVTLRDDGSVGMVELHALMANRFRDQREQAEREAKTIKDKADKDLAEILRCRPGEDLSGRSVGQVIATIEAEREGEGRTLQAFVRQAKEDTAATKSRQQGYSDRYTAAERSLRDEQRREVEDKKTCDAVLGTVREFVNRAPALLQDIGEIKRAVAAAKEKKNELIPKERKLKKELEKL